MSLCETCVCHLALSISPNTLIEIATNNNSSAAYVYKYILLNRHICKNSQLCQKKQLVQQVCI